MKAPFPTRRICAEPGCDRRLRGKGNLCRAHWLSLLDGRRARACECGRHGFAGLTRGAVAFVDADDVPTIANLAWSLHAGYAYSRNLAMHRVIAGEPGKVTDHKDGDRLNNRRGNLRTCSHAENMRNRRMDAGKPLPLKGVYLSFGKYRPKIMKAGKVYLLGSFVCPYEAARAYDRAAEELHGEFALTNAALGLIPEGAA